MVGAVRGTEVGKTTEIVETGGGRYVAGPVTVSGVIGIMTRWHVAKVAGAEVTGAKVIPSRVIAVTIYCDWV